MRGEYAFIPVLEGVLIFGTNPDGSVDTDDYINLIPGRPLLSPLWNILPGWVVFLLEKLYNILPIGIPVVHSVKIPIN